MVVGSTGGLSFPMSMSSNIFSDFDIDFAGKATTALPTAGTYKYQGVVFDNKDKGNFNYNIDFGTKTGWGDVQVRGRIPDSLNKTYMTKINTYSYADKEDVIAFKGYGFKGSTANGGDYILGIMGDNADEVAGSISGFGTVFGLAATKH